MIDSDLLEILACPKCKEKLFYSRVENKLICRNDEIYFSIEDNIPNLLDYKDEI
ncbi:MAG: Trm112 family protein [Pseudomonadota bacterium]|nr:Trm112 family protein [Pseudomonadota bacterium]